MYKDINTLLLERKTEEERLLELKNLLPNLMDGKKIYYDKDSYIYHDGENLYNGTDKYPKDSLIKGCFPYIFILSSIYNANKFAMEAENFEAFHLDKKFKKTEEGFLTYPEIGVIAEASIIKDFLDTFKAKEKEAEKLVEAAIEVSEKEVEKQGTENI